MHFYVSVPLKVHALSEYSKKLKKVVKNPKKCSFAVINACTKTKSKLVSDHRMHALLTEFSPESACTKYRDITLFPNI